MARLLPNTPLGAANAETLKLFRLLKHLPDEEFTVWHRLALSAQPGPDFLVLRSDGRAAFLSVSSATLADAQAATQPSLLATMFHYRAAPEPLAQETINALLQFAATSQTQIPAIILFPNLSEAELKRALPPNPPAWIAFAGKDNFHPDRFRRWLEQHLSPSLTSETITRIRKTFTPEVVIPPQFTVRTLIARNTQAQLTNYLLDYDQEWVLKNELALNREGEATAKDFGLHLVNGVAGSGKSLILLYRAHLLHQLYPRKQILFLTLNRPLIRDLERRYQILSSNGQSDEPIVWKTFDSWCVSLWMRKQPPPDIVTQRRRRELIQQTWREVLPNTSISERMLAEEMDWYKDRLFFSRADYLAADRTGRGFALNEALRNQAFDAFEVFHRALRVENRVDWSDVPRRVWQWTQRGEIQLPTYDIVLVDEAQFFAPIWFEIIKRVLKPTTGHLFLAADPTQGFLKRRQSWLASGLDVRGHATRLQKSYRTTREILDFATLLYRSRLPDDDDDIVMPNMLDMPNGVLPEIIPLTSEQDEITRVVNEVVALVRAGVPCERLLIIHANYLGGDRLRERLDHVLGAGAAIDPKNESRGEHIRVCTLNAATGLESPIVFLVGMHELYEEEQSIRLSEEERLELVRDNTRKLYMAITRAGQRLVMTYTGEIPAMLRIAPSATSAR